jgi:hypothetical protein
MAIEPRRGCGYRKAGGLYLVSGGAGMPCCRLPLPLTVCPCCGAGIKQTRGWTWVNPTLLFGESYRPECNACPAGNPSRMGERAGLIWIGERFYKTPAAFDAEAASMGISRRVSAIPRGFKVGETWVLLAHPKAIARPKAEDATSVFPGSVLPRLEYTPGVFRIFRPERIEKILTQSQATPAELAKLHEAGITPVIVPDGDRDHQGTVYDDDEPELPLTESVS